VTVQTRSEGSTNPRGNVILTSKLERIVAERIRNEIEPLREAGKLGAFLLQLSPSFSPRKHKLDELDQLITLFRDDGRWGATEQKSQLFDDPPACR